MGMRGFRHTLSAPGGSPDVGRVRSERNMRGGSGSGKGSPAFTGQVILLFCRMRRRAHVPRRSQDHLRVNGVDKRRGVGVDPCSRCSSALPAHKTTSWGRGGVPGRLCVDLLSQNVPRSNDRNPASTTSAAWRPRPAPGALGRAQGWSRSAEAAASAPLKKCSVRTRQLCLRRKSDLGLLEYNAKLRGTRDSHI